jgi:hypothetical protein
VLIKLDLDKTCKRIPPSSVWKPGVEDSSKGSWEAGKYLIKERAKRFRIVMLTHGRAYWVPYTSHPLLIATALSPTLM